MTQNYPILPYKMLVNPKEIVIINLFYNLPHFFIQFIQFFVGESIWTQQFKKKLKNAIYDKEFWPRRESNRGPPGW